MGRELKRVPLDFNWPQNKVWQGYINPHYDLSRQCTDCAGSGESPEARRLHQLWYGRIPFQPESRGSTPWTPQHPAIRNRAERNVTSSPQYYGGVSETTIDAEAKRLCDYYNTQWAHHLNDDDVRVLVQEGRLMDFTHEFTPGEGWKPKADHVMPTAAEVNAWSLHGFGHDSINAWVVIRAELERQGHESMCPHCHGEGRLWPSQDVKTAYDTWEQQEPPKGEGYQLWETVSEGSPVSPVFDTPEGLAHWLANHRDGSITEGTSYQKWMAFIVGPGWAPSMIGTDRGLVSGVEAMAELHLRESGTRLLT